MAMIVWSSPGRTSAAWRASGSVIDFTIDAVIASEFWDGPSLRVQGRFRGSLSAFSPY